MRGPSYMPSLWPAVAVAIGSLVAGVGGWYRARSADAEDRPATTAIASAVVGIVLVAVVVLGVDRRSGLTRFKTPTTKQPARQSAPLCWIRHTGSHPSGLHLDQLFSHSTIWSATVT